MNRKFPISHDMSPNLWLGTLDHVGPARGAALLGGESLDPSVAGQGSSRRPRDGHQNRLELATKGILRESASRSTGLLTTVSWNTTAGPVRAAFGAVADFWNLERSGADEMSALVEGVAANEAETDPEPDMPAMAAPASNEAEPDTSGIEVEMPRASPAPVR